ncbi:MAG: peptide deformylase, partial [Nitrospinota bacterium]
MARREIRLYPDPILRARCARVEKVDRRIRRLAADMVEALHAAPGIGLAAPQVGEAIRLIVVDTSAGLDPDELLILVNPELVYAEGEAREEEACLSLPEVREEVKRAALVRVRGLNLEGEKVRVRAEGLRAQVLQHEIDHLEGILFIDHLSRLKREVIKRRLKRPARACPAGAI